jgi:hypothetical protein
MLLLLHAYLQTDSHYLHKMKSLVMLKPEDKIAKCEIQTVSTIIIGLDVTTDLHVILISKHAGLYII